MIARNPRSFTSSFAVSITLVFSLFVTVSVYSQVTGATLSGTVTDATGASIPGAQISITNTATGVTRELTADSAGFYTARGLMTSRSPPRDSARRCNRTSPWPWGLNNSSTSP
jgi:Carboxypeptidase regulatory-like domain